MSTAHRELATVKDFTIDEVIQRLRPFCRETTVTFSFGDRSKLAVSVWKRPDGVEVITRMNAYDCPKKKVPPFRFTAADEIERELTEPR